MADRAAAPRLSTVAAAVRLVGGGPWWLSLACLGLTALAVGLPATERYRWLLGAVPIIGWTTTLWLAARSLAAPARVAVGIIGAVVLAGPLVRPAAPLRWHTHLLGSAPQSTELWSSALPDASTVAIRRMVAGPLPQDAVWRLMVRYAWRQPPPIPAPHLGPHAEPHAEDAWLEAAVNGEVVGAIRLWRNPEHEPCCVAHAPLPGFAPPAGSVVEVRLRQLVRDPRAGLVAQGAPSFSQLGQRSAAVEVDGVEYPGVLHGYTGRVVPGAWHIWLEAP